MTEDIFNFILLQMCWWSINHLPAAQSSVHVHQPTSSIVHAALGIAQKRILQPPENQRVTLNACMARGRQAFGIKA